MNIGKAIRKAREEAGKTQRLVAKESGVTAYQLCNIENGHSYPRKETLEAICKNLGISVDYVYALAIEDNGVNENYKNDFHFALKILVGILKRA